MQRQNYLLESGEQSTRQKGKVSEQIAENFLFEKGYEIIKRNFQWGKLGEIDIVAKDKNILVFVEVKSCTTKLYGDPLFFVTPQKARQLQKVAQGYLYVNKITDQDCRFDIVAIDFSEKPYVITHLENAILY